MKKLETYNKEYCPYVYEDLRIMCVCLQNVDAMLTVHRTLKVKPVNVASDLSGLTKEFVC